MIKEFLCERGNYRDDKTFSKLTTVKMGGEIAHYVEPYNLACLKEIIDFLKAEHIPFKVIGNGSNLICGSSRFEGVVISLKNFNNFEVYNDQLYVEAGVMMPFLCMSIAKLGLSGLEFASGIPGSVGGLVFMNAGAYKKSMADVVTEVLVLKGGEICRMKKDELKLSYRYSIFQEHPRWIVIACYMTLEHGDADEILDLIKDRKNRRMDTQPLDKPSAGSCFRNPEGGFAWKYIDEVGLRGANMNGAEISTKHPNFIINAGGGTGEDYLALALKAQEEVKKKFDVKLIMEVEKFNC